MNPVGTYIFSGADEGKPVTMTYTVKSATGFSRCLTPRYDLTDADFIADKDQDPINVERVDVYSLPSIQRVEVTSRSNSYSMTPVEARDQAQIEMFGPRVGSTISAHEICDEFTIGPKVAQLILQRALYVRAKYHFKLSLGILPARPDGRGDDQRPGLGLNQANVRIIYIEEDDNGLLTVIAEELVSGIGTATANPSAGALGQQHSFEQRRSRSTTRCSTSRRPRSPAARRKSGPGPRRSRAAPACNGAAASLGLARRHDLSAGGDHHRTGQSRRCSPPRCRSPSPASTTSTRSPSTCR